MRVSLLFSLCLLVLPVSAQQAPLDTTRVYPLETVVVTADRAATRLGASTAAVSVVTAEELRRLPTTGLADVLAHTPGFAFFNLDGLGYEPQPTVRGFYGGGEAEYVVVLVDGRPINNLEAGLVNWNQVPLAGVASVEILRGGVSSLYGDAAIGGVVNLVTDPAARGTARLAVQGGSFGTVAAQASTSWQRGSLFGDLTHVDGFRDHAGRTFGSLGGSYVLRERAGHRLAVSALVHARSFEEPGPLRRQDLDAARTASLVFFRFDRTEEQTYRLALDATAALGAGAFSGSITGEYRERDAIRTIPLSPDFADTQERLIEAPRVQATAQFTLARLPAEGRLVAGVDASYGSLDTRYYAINLGDGEAYAMGSGLRGEQVAEGSAARAAAAAFVQLDIHPAPRLKLSAGARLDRLRDTFDAAAGGEEVPAATHTAFSPKAGLNFRYAQSARNVGHVYASVGQSFKAPTLDQLYDLRAFPIPFPPFSVSISNPMLDPQRGTSLEAGLYHHAEVAASVAADLSLSVYQIDMTDEIDFSFETFSNVNIGESRHRGLESGLKLSGPGGVAAFVNYTLQDVTFSKGEHAGNAVKAIPRHAVSGGLSAAHRSGLAATLTLKTHREMYLDDANTRRLPDYTTVDARLAYQRARYAVTLDAFNLFDAAYSTTGFPDPSGSDVVFLYPAAGRALRLGLSVTI